MSFSTYLNKPPQDPKLAELETKRDAKLRELQLVDKAVDSLQAICEHKWVEIDISGHNREEVTVCVLCKQQGRGIIQMTTLSEFDRMTRYREQKEAQGFPRATSCKMYIDRPGEGLLRDRHEVEAVLRSDYDALRDYAEKLTVERDGARSMSDTYERIVGYKEAEIRTLRNAAVTATERAESFERSLLLSQQSHARSHRYALELHERLLKYEPGSVMRLNKDES